MTWMDIWVFVVLVIISVEVGIFTIAFLYLSICRLRVDVREWFNSRRIEKAFKGARYG